jgi:hypothetical protein
MFKVLHCKNKRLSIPGEGELVNDITAEDGKIDNLFLQCRLPKRHDQLFD